MPSSANPMVRADDSPVLLQFGLDLYRHGHDQRLVAHRPVLRPLSQDRPCLGPDCRWLHDCIVNVRRRDPANVSTSLISHSGGFIYSCVLVRPCVGSFQNRLLICKRQFHQSIQYAYTDFLSHLDSSLHWIFIEALVTSAVGLLAGFFYCWRIYKVGRPSSNRKYTHRTSFLEIIGTSSPCMGAATSRPQHSHFSESAPGLRSQRVSHSQRLNSRLDAAQSEWDRFVQRCLARRSIPHFARFQGPSDLHLGA